MLTQKGFVYEENALAESDEVRSVSVSDQVNINTASVEELMSVSGIGEVTAEKIIASREEEGAFDDVHDLVARGILGEGKLEQISAYLRVD
ncbi:MAG: helix-hairpin-helix domain-containing protein [Firmicutes bacterium]|nr:helix-hairpin-helix domain-containing protein [Bacillota bacterium]